MKTEQQFEAAVLDAVFQVLPRGAPRGRPLPEADMRADLGIDSIGLISLINLIDEALHIDLSVAAHKVAEARLVGDLLRICREVYYSKAGISR